MTKPPFRYSGNKFKLIQKLNLQTLSKLNFQRIVEPYIGSGCFSMQFQFPFVGIDVNPDVIELWEWLKVTDENELVKLQKFIESVPDKTDVRSLNLSGPQTTYIRINMCGVYNGQLFSYAIYRQYKLPIKNTINCLSRIKNGTFINAKSSEYIPQSNDLIFIDPPYMNTSSGYISNRRDFQKLYDPIETNALINKINDVNANYVFTYGENADVIFSHLNWTCIREYKLPRINNKKRGMVTRKEYITSNIEGIINEN